MLMGRAIAVAAVTAAHLALLPLPQPETGASASRVPEAGYVERRAERARREAQLFRAASFGPFAAR